MENWSVNTSAVFIHANPNLLPTPRSPSKPYIYASKPSPRKGQYISPFRDGKAQEGYVSPTFISNDCFYPHIKTPTPQYTSHKAYEGQPLTPKSSALYDTYVRRQTHHQKNQTQPVMRIAMPQEVFDNQSRSPQQAVSPKSFRSNDQSPLRTPNRQSKTPVPVTAPRSDYSGTRGSDNSSVAYTRKTDSKRISSPQSTCSKTPSRASSMVTQQICLNCFNQDLIEDHQKRDKYARKQDKELLDKNLASELKRIQEEVNSENQRRDLERKVMDQEFRDFQKRKKAHQEHVIQEKEQIRRLNTEQLENMERKAKEEHDQEVQKRAEYLKGIQQQLAEREHIRKQEQKRQQLQIIPNSFEIGEEYKIPPLQQLKTVDRLSIDANDLLKQVRKEKQKENQQRLNDSLERALQLKEQAKVALQQKDLEYAEYARRQDELNRQIQQFEKLQKDMKKQQLNAGLDEQLRQKRERLKVQRQKEDEQLKHVKIFEATTDPPKQLIMDNCDGCTKEFMKEYLSKVKRPKSKMKQLKS